MTIHSSHPDTHEHGLHTGCPRCAEHAEHPIQSLDDHNLRRVLRIATADRRHEQRCSELDWDASEVVLEALRTVGPLARVDPGTFARYFAGWGVSLEVAGPLGDAE